VHLIVNMDHIAGHQEVRSTAPGLNRLNGDLVSNHPISHFSLPFENHPLFNRQSSCGLPNSQPDVDGFGRNRDLEQSSPWHFVAFSESNPSGRDSLNAEQIVWPIRPEMHSVPALRRSTSGDIHSFADQGVCYSPVDQSHEFRHTDILPSRMHHSSLFSSGHLPANLSAPPVSSQTEACFHLSRSLLHELSVSSSSPGQSDSYFSQACCESDKGLHSNDIKWDTQADKNLRGFSAEWSAVNNDTTWSSNADYVGTIGSSRCSQRVCQSDSRHCLVPSCVCNRSPSHSNFGSPTSVEKSCPVLHSSDNMQEFGHLSTLTSTPSACDRVFSSRIENILHGNESRRCNRLHNQVQSRDSSCSSASSQDVGSPRAHVSYSEAARHGRNSASTKCSEAHKRFRSPDIISKTPVGSSNSSAVQFMISGGKQDALTAVQRPSCASPMRRHVESGASVPSRTIDHYSKYGLDFLDECEPCLSGSKVRHGSSDKSRKTNLTMSASEDQHVDTGSCADISSPEIEAHLSESADSVRQVRQQGEGNLFFDPRRIFSAEKKKVTNSNSAEVLKVELQSVQVESIGPANENSTDKPFFDPRRIFSMDHRPKRDDGRPTVDLAKEAKKSCSGEAISVGLNSDTRPSQGIINISKECCSSPESMRHDHTESTTTMPTHAQQHYSSSKSGSRSNDKPVTSSVSSAQNSRQHHDVRHTLNATEDGVAHVSGVGHNKGRSGREPVINKYGRTKHSNRRKPTSHRHGSSASQVHTGRLRSDVSSPGRSNEDGINGSVNYIWMKIDGEHLQQMLGIKPSCFEKFVLNIVVYVPLAFVSSLHNNCYFVKFVWLQLIILLWTDGHSEPNYF